MAPVRFGQVLNLKHYLVVCQCELFASIILPAGCVRTSDLGIVQPIAIIVDIKMARLLQ